LIVLFSLVGARIASMVKKKGKKAVARKQAGAASKGKKAGSSKGKAGSSKAAASKRRQVSATAAEAKKAEPPKVNPYEVFQNRKRHMPILGQRVRGERRDLAKSRAAATSERQRGILTETLEGKRSSTFKDGRLGSDLDSKENRAVQRLVHLRQKQAKRSFQLDGNASKDGFTVGGRPLDEVDDAELRGAKEAGSDDDAELATLPDGDISLVEASKLRKVQEAKDRAVHDLELENLDADFGDLMGELGKSMRPTKQERIEKRIWLPNEESDGYDKLVKAMSTERRVIATERTKTPEEIAREKAEKLEELEKARLKRSEGLDDDEPGGEDEDDDGTVHGTVGGTSDTTDRLTPVDKAGNDVKAEDEDDDEDADEEGEEEEDAEEAEEEVSVEGKAEGGEAKASQKDDDDEEEDEEGGEDDEDDELAEGCLALLSTKDIAGLDIMANGADEKDLPYSFECPASASEISELIKGRSAKTAFKVVQRIRACTSIARAAENRAKLKAFFVALLEFTMKVAAREDGDVSARGAEIVYAMRPVLIEMAGEYPEETYTFFGQRLRSMGPKTLPRAAELCCLKLVTLLFPVTDMQHPIATPAALLADHWASKIAALGAGITDLVSDAMLLWEVLRAFVAPGQRFSAAYFTLGVAILETCWSSAASGRTLSADAAKDVGRLLVRDLESLAEADVVAARVAANSLLRPAVKRAMSGDAKAEASSLAEELDKIGSDSTAGLEPLKLFETTRAQIKMLDPIFYEEGDRPQKGAELTETKRLKRLMNEERRAAKRQLQRDSVAVQQIKAKKETKRRVAQGTERVRVRSIMEGEKQMLSKLRTESGGGMDTSLGSYSKNKEKKKENRRLGGNATDDTKGLDTKTKFGKFGNATDGPIRTGTPNEKYGVRRKRPAILGGGSYGDTPGAAAPEKKKGRGKNSPV